MITFWRAIGGSLSLIFTVIRILFLLLLFLAESLGTHRLVGSDPKNYPSPPEYSKELSSIRPAVISEEMGAHDLASSWCSAYRMTDPGRLAALETQEMEIVDRFGDWHQLIGPKARERFWADGLDVMARRDFRPECTVQHVRLIGSNAATAQVRVSYDEGIVLKGGERIPPFSEIHTLLLVRIEGTWLISAQDIVQRGAPSVTSTYTR